MVELNTLIDKETKQVNTLLKALAEAKCPDCLAYVEPEDYADCKTCNGSGLDRRTELFRVKCEQEYLHREHNHFKLGWPHSGNCKQHLAYCTGTRPLTPAEARGKIEDMLIDFGLTVGPWTYKGFTWHAHCEYDNPEGRGMTPLLAILFAVASTVGLKVTI